MELIDKFIKFEYEEDLFNKEIQRIKFWHFIRFSIYNEILKRKYNFGQAHSNLSGKKFITKVWYKLKQIPNFVLKNPLYGLKQRDILVLNCARRIRNGRYYKDIYTDDILKNINYTYYVFEESYLEKHFKPIKTKNVRYFDYIIFVNAIKKRVLKLFNHDRFNLSNNEVFMINSLLQNINKEFDVHIEIDKTMKSINNLIITYYMSKKFYKNILDKINPKVIIEECSYEFSRFIINEIAKKRGIPIIELQHGTMGKYHIAYNFFKKMELSTFPDYIFLFGKHWKDNTRFPIKNDKLIITGFPYFEKRINEIKNETRKNNRKIKNILFISQGNIGKQLSKLAIKINKLINHKKYNIIYKLHPGEYDRWNNEYPWLKKSNIEIVDNNKNDIYYYFSKCNFQVGVNSTAIFEGLGFNLKTFIYTAYGYKYMKDLYENNYAQLVTSADDIINQLNNDKKNIKNKEFFWKSNSLKNIINNIKNICDYN